MAPQVRSPPCPWVLTAWDPQEAAPPRPVAPSAASPELKADPETSRSDADAAVIGQWGGATEGSPVLWFAPGGLFNGHDGCNSLTGRWMEAGRGFELRDMTMTLIG